jgi:hypothetical protein
MIIIKLNRIIKLNSVCVAFPDICCVVAGVAELMDVTELQQISLEIFQFLIDQYSQEKRKEFKFIIHCCCHMKLLILFLVTYLRIINSGY